VLANARGINPTTISAKTMQAQTFKGVFNDAFL
jgi:hypothetical protein